MVWLVLCVLDELLVLDDEVLLLELLLKALELLLLLALLMILALASDALAPLTTIIPSPLLYDDFTHSVIYIDSFYVKLTRVLQEIKKTAFSDCLSIHTILFSKNHPSQQDLHYPDHLP